MAAEGIMGTLTPVVTLLAAAVVAVPLFRRLGLGSVLGYFCAGLIIGPFGLALFTDPASILHVSELGVVMFLFIIGLEMKPQRLWALRGEIFGLGVLQVTLCTMLLTGAAWALGFPLLAAFVAGAGFVLSSTAVVVQVLKERGEAATPHGQQAISILLLEDLAIVPLLVLVAVLAPAAGDGTDWQAVVVAIAALAALLAAGRWLLDPALAMLARARTREVMTAGSLLIALGAAFLMEVSGLSMAMGAFIAGVLLSGSGYRHQIEADIEPFKGILLGLFFLAVGMSLDIGVVLRDWQTILALLGTFMAVKAFGIFVVARVMGSSTRQAVGRVALFTQGGEFAFVLYAAAFGAGLLDARSNAVFSAVIILSMALTPLVLVVVDRLMPRAAPDTDGVEAPVGLQGRALLIGFGRFGQVASQALLARGVELAIIENDPDRIREAARFGRKVYYGDGTRLDILRAAGAEGAELILVCIDDRAGAIQIAKLVQAEFPTARLLVRAWDRGHAIDLVHAGVANPVRETFESALAFGASAISALGATPLEVEQLVTDLRRRDSDRLAVQIAEGLYAGIDSAGAAVSAKPVPEPLTPRRTGRGA